jgi:signal transduction histidine kinase
MAIVTLRFRLFEREPSLRVAGAAIAVGTLVVVVDTIAFRLADNGSIAVAAATVAAGAFVLGGREWLAARAAARERRAELVALGRFSAQMAHDVRNPLAALRGSVQLLKHDLAAPQAGLDRIEFVDLMAEQIARLERIVDTYGRLARVDLVRDRVSLNEIVRGVLRRESASPPDARIDVQEDFDEALPAPFVDRDMFATVVENLVRNAVEAMPAGGTLRVKTFRPAGAGEPVGLCVEDTGVGMDARTRERAFDDFFTTKATGTGLGLAFVQRIVEAHGGRVFLASEVGKGTTVQVVLPQT